MNIYSTRHEKYGGKMSDNLSRWDNTPPANNNNTINTVLMKINSCDYYTIV